MPRCSSAADDHHLERRIFDVKSRSYMHLSGYFEIRLYPDDNKKDTNTNHTHLFGLDYGHAYYLSRFGNMTRQLTKTHSLIRISEPDSPSCDSY